MIKYKALILMFVMLMLLPITQAYTHSNWETFGGNYQHTNIQEGTINNPIHNNVIWSTNVTGNKDSYGSVIINDGIVYAVGKDYDGAGNTYWGRDNVTALYLKNGTIKWEYEVGDDVGFDDSATYYNGYLYVPTDGRLNKEDAQIICIYANNGTVRWNTSLPWVNEGTGSAIIDEENNLVILESVGKLWGLYHNNGTIKYNISLNGKTESSVSYYDGYVYAAINSANSLTCHYSNNGTLKWTASTGQVWDAAPLIVPEYNAIYIAINDGTDTDDTELSCVNMTTGNIIWNWSQTLEASRVSTPAYKNGKLYYGSAAYFYCLNASTSSMSNDTREIWNISKHDGAEYNSPVVSGNYVYYQSADKYIKCINITNGVEEWQHELNLLIDTYCGDMAMADGIILFTYDDGKVYAMGNTTQLDGVEKATQVCVNYTVSPIDVDVIGIGDSVFSLVGIFMVIGAIFTIIVVVTKYKY